MATYLNRLGGRVGRWALTLGLKATFTIGSLYLMIAFATDLRVDPVQGPSNAVADNEGGSDLPFLQDPAAWRLESPVVGTALDARSLARLHLLASNTRLPSARGTAGSVSTAEGRAGLPAMPAAFVKRATRVNAQGIVSAEIYDRATAEVAIRHWRADGWSVESALRGDPWHVLRRGSERAIAWFSGGSANGQSLLLFSERSSDRSHSTKGKP